MIGPDSSDVVSARTTLIKTGRPYSRATSLPSRRRRTAKQEIVLRVRIAVVQPVVGVTTYKRGVQQAYVVTRPVATSPFVYMARVLRIVSSARCAIAPLTLLLLLLILMQMLPSSTETRRAMARRCSVNSYYISTSCEIRVTQQSARVISNISAFLLELQSSVTNLPSAICLKRQQNGWSRCIKISTLLMICSSLT